MVEGVTRGPPGSSVFIVPLCLLLGASRKTPFLILRAFDKAPSKYFMVVATP
jgi:hypothetical protein